MGCTLKRNREIRDWLDHSGPAFLRELGVKEGDTVLDFGCGIGSYAIPAARVTGEKGRVLAVDRSGIHLRSVRSRARRANLEDRMEFVKTGGEEHLDRFESDSCDVVLVFDVLQHLGDWAGFLSAVSRVLVPHGLLLVNPSIDSHPGKVDIDKLAETLDAAGFGENGRTRRRLMHYKHMTEDTVFVYGRV
ncbi:Erythromycin 3''-O-methyltransferase [Kiritimatiella glycovorans]|uniref:Erythromycin 3''-O-methyltransferase n=1 Tax=Kiritimatiella glycovorans TaxID=1307763 RepID=A0A0G3EBK2_9BACT|nr:Erythromycin 3''-O-methyltransferase [Kiritimatiella glycovorans]